MKILCGGVRGSIPCAEPNTTRYGGHTTCLLVTGQGGELVLLDAGSGVRTVADHLRPAAESAPALHILMTHLHLDHLLGLPMLPVLHDARWTVTITGFQPQVGSLQGALDRLLSPPLWPFSLADCAATVQVRELTPADPLPAVGGLEIRGLPVPHPGRCTAWRIDESATGTSLVLATDMEWSAAAPRQRRAFLDFCRLPQPVDLLVMDGHFAPRELSGKTGWGHSSTDECLAVARDCGAARLLITHHAPDHDDDRLDAMADHVHGVWEHAGLARQGMEISLDASLRKES